MTTANDWTYGTDADEATEPEGRFDAHCSCGWRSHPTFRDRAVRLAYEHRHRWKVAVERGIVLPIAHDTSVGPVELHGDRLAATAPTAPAPRPFGRRRRLWISRRLMTAAAWLVVMVIDRQATVELRVSTYTVERLEADHG